MGRMASDKSIIAVVDDEWSVRTMLGRVLRLAGYRVAAFSSGEDFMTSVATRLPECAIVDIHMPRMSGFDVQAALARDHWSVPVIVITGHDTQESRARALRLGAKGYLCKPVNDDVLLDAIGIAIRYRTQSDQGAK